jgi:hypothetical protein
MSITLKTAGGRSFGIFPEHLNLLCVIASAIWASVVCFLGWPGSVIAVSYGLPFALMVWEAKQSPKNRPANFALLCAALAISGVAIEPGWFNMLVAWGLLMGASLLLRKDQALNGLTVAWNALLHTLTSPFHFIKGLPLMVKLGRVIVRKAPPLPLATIALPFVASLVFLWLLAISNPVIAAVSAKFIFFDLAKLLNNLAAVFSLWALFICFAAALLLWPMLQRTAHMRAIEIAETGSAPKWHQEFFKPSAVAITLVLLNVMFLVQNLLDVKYVWLIGQLPSQVSHAQYAHRGAYSLIVTVLLAAVFVVFALRKDTPAAASKTIRMLVYLWITQNVALVASSAWRTMNYVVDMGWTEWRVSALIWISLVCFGLATVMWRVGKNFSTLWLININMAAAALVLAICAPLDIKAIVAERNIDKAIADSSKGTDYRYTETLGVSALPALLRYRTHLDGIGANTQDIEQLAFVSAEKFKIAKHIRENTFGLIVSQNDWRTWSLRRALIVSDP